MLLVQPLTNLQEVPYFDSVVACARGQHSPVRMEGYSGNPVPMPLATHEKVTVRDGPDLPRLVVANGGNDCLSRRDGVPAWRKDRGGGGRGRYVGFCPNLLQFDSLPYTNCRNQNGRNTSTLNLLNFRVVSRAG